MLEATREDEVAVEPAASWRHLRERHADLEGDARLFGKDDDRADRMHCSRDQLVQLAHDRLTSDEMMLEVVQAARVRLVPVREDASAPGTLPEWTVSDTASGLAHA